MTTLLTAPNGKCGHTLMLHCDFVPERYSLPNASLSAALIKTVGRRLEISGNLFRFLGVDDWELTGEDPKSKNSSRHRFHHWPLGAG